jgi:hypothetical protein
MTLITPQIKNIVEMLSARVSFNAKGKSYDNQISNEALVNAGLAEHLVAAAEKVGVEFYETEYTFSVTYTKDATGNITNFIGQPQVVRWDGQAVLLWGKVAKPISEIAGGTFATVAAGNSKYVVFQVGNPEEDEDAVQFSVRLEVKDAEAKTLNTWRKNGEYDKIAMNLKMPFVQTHPTKAPKGVALRVYGFGKPDNFGKIPFEVEGCGVITSNTKMKQEYIELKQSWEKNPEYADLVKYPVTISFGATKQTNDGKPYVDVTVKQDIPITGLNLDNFMFYGNPDLDLEPLEDME